MLTSKLTNVEQGTIRLRGNDIPLVIGDVAHTELQFFPENPRIYTIVGAFAEEPSQGDIFKTLKEMEHVKQLVQSIKNNGGLHEPIIVRGNLVLEGNSRLAAYRLLSETDPIKWGRIRCKLLPADVSDDMVFALLGEYHIIGKKDWSPYEQADYLFRRHTIHEVSFNDIAKELSVRVGTVKQLIKTFKFMDQHKDTDPSRWSYYEQYLKIKDIDKARCEHDGLDDAVVAKIKSGEISKAVDIRDRLKVILRGGHKNLIKFIDGERSFSDAYKIAMSQVYSDECYKTIHKFKTWIYNKEIENEIISLPTDDRKTCFYELSKVQNRVEQLMRHLYNTI